MSTQEQLENLITQFKDSWLRSDKHSQAKLFSSDIIFKSHHHGSINGQKHVSTTLSEDFKTMQRVLNLQIRLLHTKRILPQQAATLM